MRQAVILAGGKGTRLASVLGDLPKPMAPVAGKPLVEHQIELLRRHRFDELIIFACYGADVIRSHLGDGTKWGLSIRYIVEAEPLGTAGALLAGFAVLAERFTVLYGDTVIAVNLEAMLAAHLERGADATLYVHPNDHPHDSDLVETDEAGWITAFHPYPHSPGASHRNLVNAALYVIERRALERFERPPVKSDFGKDVFPTLLQQGARLFGYRTQGYIKDMGTPERLARVNGDWAKGIVARRSGTRPAGAVFLDRDGTLNEEVNRVSRAEDLRLLPGVGQAVRRFNQAGLLAIVVTNQPVIARGDCTTAELRGIHDRLETLLGEEGAFLDAIYYCPHHPDAGFPGERAELKIACNCRKPLTGLIQKALIDWKIDLRESWMIGDTTVDIQTARNAGLRAVLVRTGHAGSDGRHPVQADYVFSSLEEASAFIVKTQQGTISTTPTS